MFRGSPEMEVTLKSVCDLEAFRVMQRSYIMSCRILGLIVSGLHEIRIVVYLGRLPPDGLQIHFHSQQQLITFVNSVRLRHHKPRSNVSFPPCPCVRSRVPPNKQYSASRLYGTPRDREFLSTISVVSYISSTIDRAR